MLTLDVVPGTVIENARALAQRGYRRFGRGFVALVWLRKDGRLSWQVRFFRADEVDLAVGYPFDSPLRDDVMRNTCRYDPAREVSALVLDCRPRGANADEGDEADQEIHEKFAAIIPAGADDPTTGYPTSSPLPGTRGGPGSDPLDPSATPPA